MSSPPITASSNTKYLSIIPENGEVFNPSQKLIFNLEPNLGYIKKDSYMIFDVLNTSTNNAMVGFPQNVGAHALIDSVRIYSKHTGVLLESLENYSQLQAIINQYGHDDKSQLQLKEGVGEPCLARNNSVSADGATTSVGYRHTSSAEIANCQLSPIGAATATPENPVQRYVSRRFCVPLRAGLFRYFDEEKLIPILNFGGLRIEINLNPADLALQRLSLAQTNAGDHRGYVDIDLINGGILLNAKAGGGTAITLTNDGNRVLELGLCVGNSIRVYNPAGGAQGESDTTTTIASFAVNANKVVITTVGAIPALDATARLFTSVGPANASNTAGIDAMNYRITNAEFRIAQVVPNPQQAKELMKELKYEFTTYDVFLDNIDIGTLRHQVPINSVSSKALGILSMLYLSVYERNHSTSSYYSCETPDTNLVNSIQYFINNKLYPLRNYNPHRLNDRVLALNEVVKTLKAIGIKPKALGQNQGGQAEDYSNTFLISRELARSGFVFDLRNAEAELRLGFSGPRPNAGDRLRVNTFVFSKKIVQTTATGVEVVL